ncbi:RDD family protein [Inhella gelatinilytica]|uniref:RDD family protein n=1 Tax=Inhella gelatinilytica TaxID=2795030 RepID=A0A931NB29_9BURK|nr:RDD family protein [Inhella gelatinilytica]MBH9553128.1 RDD family protein [Inhella gelatinilytica]
MNPAAGFSTPPLRRRLACLLYEGMLVFGLLMVTGFLHALVTQQPYVPGDNHGAGWVALAAMALYFVWFWHHGQTLAMKTWFITVQDVRTGQPPHWLRALARFAGAWLMILPALALVSLLGLISPRSGVYAAVALNVLVYAGLSVWLPGRQFLHDWLAGTALVDLRRQPLTTPEPGRPPL